MINRQSIPEPFSLWFSREFLTAETNDSEDLLPIDNKVFYSELAMVVTGVIVLALTIGPFGIL
jgi:hypothetical protein